MLGIPKPVYGSRNSMGGTLAGGGGRNLSEVNAG